MSESQLVAALATPGLEDVMLTFGHPEFGIECTAVIEGRTATCINQSSGPAAIINAVALAQALGEEG